MALPSTGSISLSHVNTELKKSSNAVISLNDPDVRKLAGKTSGVISMNDLRGKSNTEYVSNYMLYNNTFSGCRDDFSFSVTIPKNIISGTISFSANIYGSGHCSFNGINKNGSFNASGFKKGKIISGGGWTGYQGSGRDERDGKIIIKITFTGEWEA